MKIKNFRKILSAILVCVILGTFLVMTACEKKETHADWEDIESKGKMIIGITEYPPMNFTAGDGSWTGFETEFAQALCAKLGVEAVFQKIDWSAKETELKSKNIDAIWNGLTVDSKRAEEMHLSVSYMYDNLAFVTTADNIEKYRTAEDVAGAVVVSEVGSTGLGAVQSDEFFANATIVEVDSQINALMEVKAGTADIAVIDAIIADYLIYTGTDYSNLAVSPNKTFASGEYAIAFRKNSPVTLEKVNGAIAELKASGELQAIADKYALGDLLIK